GGYAHLYAQDLSSNERMNASLREFVEQGGVLYAEAGAAAYLCGELVLSDGTTFAGAGVLRGRATSLFPERHFVEPQYVQVRSVESSVVGRVGDEFRGLLDGRWLIEAEEGSFRCFAIESPLSGGARSEPGRAGREGWSPRPHALITQVHAHWGSNPHFARAFVDACCANVHAVESSST
ncbi:MAG: hypothetical protein KDD44_13740, partial [Bdellovibrionales bacterium]|nr:hypothetical protein [Bdellovibrionales bacterium]